MRLVAAAALAAVALAIGSATPGVAQTTVALAPGEALVSVEARGRARGRPDTMTFQVGIVSTGQTAAGAVAANNLVAQRILETIRNAGVAPRDVRTSSFNVQPQMTQEGQGTAGEEAPRILGFVVRNQIEIRSRDFVEVQSLISRLFEAGANTVSGPRFGFEDGRDLLRAAERDAIAGARAEAENYAAAFGRRLGRLLSVRDRRRDRDFDDDGIMVTGSRIPPTPVVPGEIEIEVEVYVDFALAPEGGSR